MIRLAAFYVSEREKPYFAQVEEKYGIELVIEESGPLTVEAAKALPSGIDGVLVMPSMQTTREVIEVLHEKGVKSLATRSAGVDAIDVAAAEEYGLVVTNVAAYSPQAIAEFALMLILTSLRQIRPLHLEMTQGNFSGGAYIAHQLDSRTVGIIGYGYIGQCVAKLLAAFGPKLVVYTVEDIAPEYILPNMEIEKDFHKFLEKVNVITIHCPYVPATHHLIDATAIEHMNPETVLVNTARGPIVDAAAVLTALNTGKMKYYAADVYEFERGIFHRSFENIADIQDETFKQMLAHPQISLTPHIAFNTYTSVQNMVFFSIENSKQALGNKNK